MLQGENQGKQHCSVFVRVSSIYFVARTFLLKIKATSLSSAKCFFRWIELVVLVVTSQYWFSHVSFRHSYSCTCCHQLPLLDMSCIKQVTYKCIVCTLTITYQQASLVLSATLLFVTKLFSVNCPEYHQSAEFPWGWCRMETSLSTSTTKTRTFTRTSCLVNRYHNITSL